MSPVTLMESLLSRSRSNGVDLNIWVTLDESAAIEAAHRSETILNTGGPIGPLHGIPIGIKDIFYTKGVRTTACSPIYNDFVPEYDATTVDLLKKSGAIIMGKTITTQFACSDPSPTLNPWNHAHTPGGSSSGSAAGVAARIFPAALGSQTAGSVLRPASYNGIVGFKPTFGRISRYGVIPVAYTLDTMGTFARSVKDTALLLDVLAGYDHNDPWSSENPTHNYQKALLDPKSPPRIGLISKFFYDKSDDEVVTHTDVVAQKLRQSGALVEQVSISKDFNDLLHAHQIIMSVEAALTHQKDFKTHPNAYAPNIRDLIETGMSTSSTAYANAQKTRHHFRVTLEEIARKFDVLLTPSTKSTAPKDLTTTGDPIFQTPWTVCGFPAISLPSGLGRAGLPLGIQLASIPFSETSLLTTSKWCEEIINFDLEPPNQN